MRRRDSIKWLAGTAIGGGLLAGCNNADAIEKTAPDDFPFTLDRTIEELNHDKSVLNTKPFFTPEEMVTITVLGNIIIPKDDVSGSASDAGVPAFIDFIVKDKPELQTPMRGGIRWLNLQCLNRFSNAFSKCKSNEQIVIIDEIAWPNKAKPEMAQGVAFFNLIRNLTASGFYTSEIGVADIGYAGNKPNQWNGVPDDVQAQYKISYSEKDLKDCVKYEKAI